MHIYFKLLIIPHYKNILFAYELCGSVLGYSSISPHGNMDTPFCLNSATLPTQLFNCHYLSSIIISLSLSKQHNYKLP